MNVKPERGEIMDGNMLVTVLDNKSDWIAEALFVQFKYFGSLITAYLASKLPRHFKGCPAQKHINVDSRINTRDFGWIV